MKKLNKLATKINRKCIINFKLHKRRLNSASKQFNFIIKILIFFELKKNNKKTYNLFIIYPN